MILGNLCCDSELKKILNFVCLAQQLSFFYCSFKTTRKLTKANCCFCVCEHTKKTKADRQLASTFCVCERGNSSPNHRKLENF